MKDVTNDARQILVKILMAEKEWFGDEVHPLGCRLFNVVLDALEIPADTSNNWNRENFFERWKDTGAGEQSVEEFFNWLVEQADPVRN